MTIRTAAPPKMARFDRLGMSGAVQMAISVTLAGLVIMLNACSSGPAVGVRVSGATATSDTQPAPVSTVPGLPPEKPTGAVPIVLTPDDLAGIGIAYGTATDYDLCPVQGVAGQMQAAAITQTGVEWAFGRLAPKVGCTVPFDGGRVAASTRPPFTGVLDASGIFEKQPGGSWRMNSHESFPFPCPADLTSPYKTPGPGAPYVPLAVLNALGVRWASSGCDRLNLPER